MVRVDTRGCSHTSAMTMSCASYTTHKREWGARHLRELALLVTEQAGFGQELVLVQSGGHLARPPVPWRTWSTARVRPSGCGQDAPRDAAPRWSCRFRQILTRGPGRGRSVPPPVVERDAERPSTSPTDTQAPGARSASSSATCLTSSSHSAGPRSATTGCPAHRRTRRTRRRCSAGSRSRAPPRGSRRVAPHRCADAVQAAAVPPSDTRRRGRRPSRAGDWPPSCAQ